MDFGEGRLGGAMRAQKFAEIAILVNCQILTT
jgi:hypothetical protein